MAPTFTYNDLASDLGTTTADGLRNVANEAANYVCQLWSAYTEATTAFADPTGIGKFNNALLSRLCAPRNKAPVEPPSVQFNGGQCEGVLYNVTTEVIKPDGTSFNVFWPGRGGPIKGVSIKQTPSGSWQYGHISTSTGAIKFDVMNSDVSSNSREGLDGYKIRIVNVVRADGQPDTCGNRAPSYPPVYPPTTETKKNVNVNIGAGVVIPVGIAMVPINFDANATINPQLQVEVGPFDVTFDAGGVTISPNFTFSTNTVLPAPGAGSSTEVTINNQKKAGDCPDVITQVVDLTQVNTRLDNIQETLEDVQDCACPVKYSTSVVSLGSGNSGVVSLPSHSIQVRLVLTQIPDNPKTIQSGGENAPLQYFCGYYSFGDGIGLSARTAINTANSVFEVPTWASSFSWSLYAGYAADVSVVTLVPEKQGSELAVRQMKLKPT